MLCDSFLEVFNTVEMTATTPIHPIGELFTYHPLLRPTELHYHNFLELGYCVSGSGVFIVDGEIIPFNGRCTSIIYSGQKHIAQSIDTQKSLWHFLYIDLNLLFAGYDQLLCPLQKIFHPQDFDFPNLLSYDMDSAIYELARLIMQESAEYSSDTFSSIRGLLLSLLTKHQRYMTPKTSEVVHHYAQYLEDITPILDYINMHYMEDIRIDDLSNIFHCSKSSLQRKFTIATQISPIQYLHKLRINRACVLLLSQKKSIVQISLDVGYNSLSSFNRMFLHFLGESPSSWQKKNVLSQSSSLPIK